MFFRISVSPRTSRPSRAEFNRTWSSRTSVFTRDPDIAVVASEVVNVGHLLKFARPPGGGRVGGVVQVNVGALEESELYFRKKMFSQQNDVIKIRPSSITVLTSFTLTSR